MKLLVVTSSFPLHPGEGKAAAGLFVADLCRTLAEQGHDVWVATPDRDGTKERWEGFDVHWLPWRGGAKPLSQMRLGDPRQWRAIASLVLGAPGQIARLGTALGADGVIAMWAVPSGWWSLRFVREAGVPLVSWCLGSDVWWAERNPVLRAMLRRVLRRSAGVFADGLELRDQVTAYSGEECEFLPSSRRLEVPVVDRSSRSGPLFFFVGRYVEVKGVDVLLDAFEDYLDRGGRGRLVLRGGGPLAGELGRRADSLGDRVELGGFIDQEELATWLARCDVVLVPSRLESIPLVYSDALKAGRPLVCSDAGDMGRLMERHQAGLRVPAGDAPALAEALLEIDRDGTERFARAVASAAREFDLETASARLIDALEGGMEG